MNQCCGGRGLTGAESETLRGAVQRLGAWIFDQHLTCDGEAFALATHQETETTVVMFGVAGRIDVCELRDDALRPLASFDDAGAAAEFTATKLRNLL